MLVIYRLCINLLFLLSPFIIIIRLFKKKEDLKRFKEKFCIFSKKKRTGKLIWFHGASVGEIQSIVPLLEKFEKEKDISNILITTNTLSSSKIIKKLKSKKIIHQFFPIDLNLFTKKFINFWSPEIVFFIDSEIWPNMLVNLERKNIPIILLNGRITKKTFSKWKILKKFSKEIFSKFTLCLSSNNISEFYLKKLGAINVKLIGNLKYSQSENEKIGLDSKLKKFILSKKTWCASSTHENEERICGLAHKELKKRYKNLLTIIIPRHAERAVMIAKELEQLNLKIQLHEPTKKIHPDTDIYIVNTYGMTKSFYNYSSNVFLGGSLINHGGQNPLEAARYGCNILHGPNISNFEEIYYFLNKNKISKKIYNQKTIAIELNRLFLKRTNSKQIKNEINVLGKKILKNTYKEIDLILNNAI
jgi:3-deoxy-D-manno-octulosonic-acid transferase